MARLFGSIDLTKVPKELFKKVTLSNGEVHTYLNISIGERKTPMEIKGSNRVIDHFISCQPKKEERKEGVNYFIGDLTEWKKQATASVVTAEAVDMAPSADEDDLPF